MSWDAVKYVLGFGVQGAGKCACYTRKSCIGVRKFSYWEGAEHVEAGTKAQGRLGSELAGSEWTYAA